MTPFVYYAAAFCLCTNYVISGAWTSRLLFLLWMLSARILEGEVFKHSEVNFKCCFLFLEHKLCDSREFLRAFI